MADLIPALSVQSPWAQLIGTGDKTIENRRWTTAYRGPLVIHSGRTFDPAGVELALANDVRPPAPQDCAWGFIAVTWLHGMHHAAECPVLDLDDDGHECARWGAPGQWHWQLRDTVPFPDVVDGPGARKLFAAPTRARRLALELTAGGDRRG